MEVGHFSYEDTRSQESNAITPLPKHTMVYLTIHHGTDSNIFINGVTSKYTMFTMM